MKPPARPHLGHGLAYALGAATLFVAALWLPAPWLILVWPALSLALVAAGYLGFGPGVFGKTNGRISLPARLALGPFLLALRLWRLRDRGRDGGDAVRPNLRLGGVVTGAKARRLVAEGVTAVLDLTCEHDEHPALRALDYRNVQVLDGTLPDAEALAEAVDFVRDNMQRGVVYVHCARGYGRGAVVAAAVLLAGDPALTVEDACRAVRRARPRARFGKRAMEALKR